MASLVQSGKYGAMDTTGTSTMGYYVIKFVSESYTLQYDTTCNGVIVSAGELVVKAQYIRFMQKKTNWHWEQKGQQKVIIVTTRTIVIPCIDFVVVKYVHNITKNIYNINNKGEALLKHPLCMTDSDHDYILEEI